MRKSKITNEKIYEEFNLVKNELNSLILSIKNNKVKIKDSQKQINSYYKKIEEINIEFLLLFKSFENQKYFEIENIKNIRLFYKSLLKKDKKFLEEKFMFSHIDDYYRIFHKEKELNNMNTGLEDREYNFNFLKMLKVLEKRYFQHFGGILYLKEKIKKLHYENQSMKVKLRNLNKRLFIF